MARSEYAKGLVNTLRIWQNVNVSRISMIYKADFGHLDVKFSGYNEVWCFEIFIFSRNYDAIITLQIPL